MTILQNKVTCPGPAGTGIIYNVQALRAVASLLVVFVHLGPLLAVLGLPKFGEEGVNLFFVISGFIMVSTTARRSLGPPEFMMNRVARIVPLYWMCTFFITFIAILKPNLLQSTHIDIQSFIKSLTFLPYRRLGGPMEPVLFVGWTLNYEMAFYVLFSVSLLFKDKEIGFVFTVEILLALVALGLVVRGNDLWKFYTNQIVLDFAAGMWLGILAPAWPRLTARAPCWAALLIGLTAAVLLVGNPVIFPDNFRRATAGVEATVLVAVAIGLEARGLRMTSPFLLMLGDASYAIYLSHPFVIQGLLTVARRFVTLTPASSLALICLSLALVSWVGRELHVWAEAPLSKLARRVLHAPRLVPNRKDLP